MRPKGPFIGARERIHPVLGGIPAAGRQPPPAPSAAHRVTATIADWPQAAAEPDAELRSRSRRARDPATTSAAAARTMLKSDEAVLELGDHRGRRVLGGALPDAAMDGGDEIQDPGADGDRQRRRSRQSRGDRSIDAAARRERHGQPGIEHVTGDDREQLWRMDMTAVAIVQSPTAISGADRRDAASPPAAPSALTPMRDRPASDAAAPSSSAPLSRSSRHEPDGDERQQEGGGQLAGAERRRPDADERRERLADPRAPCRSAAQLRRMSGRRADERHADERARSATSITHQELAARAAPATPCAAASMTACAT